MSGRRGDGWVDVTVEGETVGFVVVPSRDGGKWYCYVDKPNDNSERVGSAPNKDKAFALVRSAHERRK